MGSSQGQPPPPLLLLLTSVLCHGAVRAGGGGGLLVGLAKVGQLDLPCCWHCRLRHNDIFGLTNQGVYLYFPLACSPSAFPLEVKFPFYQIPFYQIPCTTIFSRPGRSQGLLYKHCCY